MTVACDGGVFLALVKCTAVGSEATLKVAESHALIYFHGMARRLLRWEA